MSLINKGWCGTFFACEVWCVVDDSSIGASSEQTEVRVVVNF